MKTNSKWLIALSMLFAITAFNPVETQAQFLKELGRAAGNKLKKKVEDKVVETLAEEIARRAFRPINDVMDDWIRENMKRDSTYAGMSDDSLAIVLQGNYSKILNSMNRAADVPDSYEFEYVMDVKVTDGKDSHKIKWLIDEEGEIMAWEQLDGEEDQIMLMDLKNDIIVMYNQKTKEAQALPGMMSLGTAFAAASIENEAINPGEIVKKGGSKTVAGYKCDQYFYEDDEYESETWVSQDVPFSYKSAFGTLYQRVSPKLFKDGHEAMSGMMLEATSKEKGKRKGKYKSISTWETLSISEKPLVITNKTYKFGMGS